MFVIINVFFTHFSEVDSLVLLTYPDTCRVLFDVTFSLL